MAEEVKYPSYRWIVLLIAWMLYTMVVCNWNFTVTRTELISLLGLSTPQFLMIYTGPTLAGIFLCIIGGVLGDRYGIRLIVGIGGVVAVTGCLLRLTSTGFGTMFVYTILLGIGLSVIFPNLPKLAGLWFPPKQVPLATGIYMTGTGLGMSLALGTGPYFSSFRSAQLILGILLAVCTVAWIIFARNRPAGIASVAHERGGVMEGLGHSLRSRNIWFAIIIMMLIGVMLMSYVGSLPLTLPAKGMSIQAASMISALTVIGFLVGTIFWPILSMITGLRNPIFIATMALAGLTGFLVYFLAPGTGMWILAIFPGFFVAPGPVFMMATPVQLPEIGPRFAGSAAGLLLTAFYLGAFIGLPYIMAPILHVNKIGAFGFLFAVGVVTGLLVLGIIELGRKAVEKRAKEAAK